MMDVIRYNLWKRMAIGFAVGSFLLMMGGCSHLSSSQQKSRAQIDHQLISQLEAHPPKAKQLKILVEVSTQTGELLANGERVATFPVSTGKQGHSTPYGNFSIYNKEKENTSSLYGSVYNAQGKMIVPYADSRKDRVPKGGRFEGASMPYTMHFTGYCAFHEGFVPNPPSRASHGCIRLTPEVAELLFRLCPVGTPVVVLL